ncbi:MAG: class I SAM-dependent methyltransferase, partial [Hyphomicrobiales bacterium]|nr:class I SAM-dependent methyltransferase [Hyphomicrobiales bacterium]
MTSETKRSGRQEAYMHDYDGALTEQVIAGRTAEIHGAFFLASLRAGMELLDCGCGPGSITCGLAKAVAPGQVIGIDLEESQVELARKNATKAGLTNVTFDTGSAYELPFEDARFDAVFSHAMLEHLRDPLAVIKEMHRVLKPGGLVGLRSVDLAATLIAPAEPALTKAHDIWVKYRLHCGGDPSLGQRLRGLLREAGFANTIGTA